MPPIRKGDGTGVAPKGIVEVRTGAGDVVYSAGGDAIPDSALLHFPYLQRSGTTIVEEIENADGTSSGLTNISGNWWGGPSDINKVVFAASSSSNIGIFDPSNDTYTSGPSHGQGSNAFIGPDTDDGGRVILPAQNASVVGFYHPGSETYLDGPAHGQVDTAFDGGVRVPDGRIIFAPTDSDNVGIFDPADNTFTEGPTHDEGEDAFDQPALADDGRVIFAPNDSSNVGIFDPSDDSYTSGPAHDEGADAFDGAALADDGRVIFAPDSSSNVGIFDPDDDSYTSGPAHNEQSASNFTGAAKADDGRIIFAPWDSNNIGIFDPSDDSYTSGPAHDEGSTAFAGAATANDGRVILAPRGSSNVGIFDPSDDSYTSGPAHDEGADAFDGALFVGSVEGFAEYGDGSGAYGDLGDWANVNFGANLDTTWSVAFTFQTTDSGVYLLGVRGDVDGGTTGFQVGAGTDGSASGEINLFISDTNDDRIEIGTDSSYNDGEKHRCVVVRSGSGASNHEIWIDGTNQTISTYDNTGLSDTRDFDASVYSHARGRTDGSADSPTEGRIENIIPCGSDLSSSEIQDDYDAQPWT